MLETVSDFLVATLLLASVTITILGPIWLVLKLWDMSMWRKVKHDLGAEFLHPDKIENIVHQFKVSQFYQTRSQKRLGRVIHAYEFEHLEQRFGLLDVRSLKLASSGSKSLIASNQLLLLIPLMRASKKRIDVDDFVIKSASILYKPEEARKIASKFPKAPSNREYIFEPRNSRRRLWFFIRSDKTLAAEQARVLSENVSMSKDDFDAWFWIEKYGEQYIFVSTLNHHHGFFYRPARTRPSEILSNVKAAAALMTSVI